MGYYSQVTIQIQDKGYEMLKKSMDEYNEGFGGFFIPDRIFRRDRDCGTDYIIQWDSIQWCPDYNDILSVESVLDKLKSMTTKGEAPDGYRFCKIRIGEEVNDIHIDFNDWSYREDGIYWQTSVPIPNGFEACQQQGELNV